MQVYCKLALLFASYTLIAGLTSCLPGRNLMYQPSLDVIESATQKREIAILPSIDIAYNARFGGAVNYGLNNALRLNFATYHGRYQGYYSGAIGYLYTPNPRTSFEFYSGFGHGKGFYTKGKDMGLIDYINNTYNKFFFLSSISSKLDNLLTIKGILSMGFIDITDVSVSLNENYSDPYIGILANDPNIITEVGINISYIKDQYSLYSILYFGLTPNVLESSTLSFQFGGSYHFNF